MEINNTSITNQLQSIYSKLEEIDKKYEKLENKQKESEKIIEINKTNLLRLNKNLLIVNNSLQEFKNQYNKEFNELINKLKKKNEIKIENDADKINLEQINNLNANFGKMVLDINKRFHEFDIITKELKMENYNKDKNQEIKIEKKDSQTQSVIKEFHNVLSSIINKNGIDEKDLKELKIKSKNLVSNNLCPLDLSNIYFSEIFKKLVEENKPDDEHISKISELNIKIIETIEKINSELNKDSEKKKSKKFDITDFRKKYEIKKEDADDKTIKDLYKKCGQDEFETYRLIIIRLANKLDKK